MKSSNLELFTSFAKIGAFTFGGGYAMVPVIEEEVSRKKNWINEGEMLDMIAISQSTPGPLAINCATFVGYRINGFWGSVFATLGVVLPSFLIIILAASLLLRYKDSRYVSLAFSGIRVGVVYLIFDASLRLSKGLDSNYLTYVILLLSFLICTFTKVNVIWVLMAGAALGLLYHLYLIREEKK